MSLEDIFSTPTERAFCLPSAITVTTASIGKSGVMIAPFDVRPGHMMLAPLRTNVIAPLSTCIRGQMNGSNIDNCKLLTSCGTGNALTFVDEPKSWQIWSISLAKEQVLTVGSDHYFDVFMTWNTCYERSNGWDVDCNPYHFNVLMASFLGSISSI